MAPSIAKPLFLLALAASLCFAHDNRPDPPPKHGGVVFTSGTRTKLHFSYERYLINGLRETFGLQGVPNFLVGMSIASSGVKAADLGAS